MKIKTCQNCIYAVYKLNDIYKCKITDILINAKHTCINHINNENWRNRIIIKEGKNMTVKK